MRLIDHRAGELEHETQPKCQRWLWSLCQTNDERNYRNFAFKSWGQSNTLKYNTEYLDILIDVILYGAVREQEWSVFGQVPACTLDPELSQVATSQSSWFFGLIRKPKHCTLAGHKCRCHGVWGIDIYFPGCIKPMNEEPTKLRSTAKSIQVSDLTQQRHLRAEFPTPSSF